MKNEKSIRIGTKCVWGGEEEQGLEGATHVPVVHSVSFQHSCVADWSAVALGTKPGHIYSRNTNPTVAVLEEKVRLLEHAEAATSAATGMGAISSTLFSLLAPGDRILGLTTSYGGTSRLFAEFLPRYGIEVTLVEANDQAFLSALSGRFDVVYLESPTNPLLEVIDITAVASLAHQQGAVVIVDNTFATPINQNPLLLGADLVIHSATKYLGGHGDALGGVVAGRRDLIERIFAFREINGASLSADAAYLILRGMKTLQLRVDRHNENAAQVAQYLANHLAVTDVYYPGLASHPNHAVAAKQMSGFGGMLSFSLGDSFGRVEKFCDAMQLAHTAASLGAVETMIGPPSLTSHVECTAKQRAALGIPEGLVRYSAGIEDIDDLLSDLEQAINAI